MYTGSFPTSRNCIEILKHHFFRLVSILDFWCLLNGYVGWRRIWIRWNWRWIIGCKRKREISKWKCFFRNWRVWFKNGISPDFLKLNFSFFFLFFLSFCPDVQSVNNNNKKKNETPLFISIQIIVQKWNWWITSYFNLML